MIEKKDVLDLTGKVAVVSGGASGIGLAAIEILTAYGAKAVMLDLNEVQAIKEIDCLKKAGKEVNFIKCDVTNIEECEKTVGQIKNEYGRIDILFNNAGVTFRRNVVDLTEQQWDLVIDVSLKGAFLLSKFVVPIMAKNGGGSIINTGSGWGLKGGDNAVAYCAAKGGLVNLTRAMAIDHGCQNIRVNSVNPGDTVTELLREEGRQLGIEENQFLKESAKGRPIERLGTPEDIANVVLFLASDLSKWITGAAIVVDGGGLA